MFYYKMSRFYYKTRQVLQNEPIITKHGTTIERTFIEIKSHLSKEVKDNFTR